MTVLSQIATPTWIALALATGCAGRTAAVSSTPTSAVDCPATPVQRATAPEDPNADPVGPADWYINPSRSIWAGTVPARGWSTGSNKTYWVRPAGEDLVVTGHLIGDPDVTLSARIPCCYNTGFQIVGLEFPAPGCWTVAASAGAAKLEFVTSVGPPDISSG